jgi:hypothetical protein
MDPNVPNRLMGPLPTTGIRLGLPRPQTVVLITLLAATLVMPVSYRAGADHAHAHTIFQGLIDTLVGHPHHHGDPVTPVPSDPVSPFTPAGVPLSLLEPHEDAFDRTDAVQTALDVPEQLGLSKPITAQASIQWLGLLIAALLIGAGSRRLFHEVPHLVSRTVGVEIPPPRQVW